MPAEIKAKVGQVWEDNDYRNREKGVIRQVEIKRIFKKYVHFQHQDVEFAECEVITPPGREAKVPPNGRPGPKKTTIRTERFKPNSTGYKLVKDVS